MGIIEYDKQVELQKLVAGSFPDHCIEIQILFAQNERFIELAKDYSYCKKEIEHLVSSNEAELISAYRATLIELEADLLRCLKSKNIQLKN